MYIFCASSSVVNTILIVFVFHSKGRPYLPTPYPYTHHLTSVTPFTIDHLMSKLHAIQSIISCYYLFMLSWVHLARHSLNTKLMFCFVYFPLILFFFSQTGLRGVIALNLRVTHRGSIVVPSLYCCFSVPDCWCVAWFVCWCVPWLMCWCVEIYCIFLRRVTAYMHWFTGVLFRGSEFCI